MIKPPRAEAISDGVRRKKVYEYEYRKLEKYCEHLEKENKTLKESVASFLDKVEFVPS